MKKISIIVSVYNEESALRQFYGESKPIFDALPWDYELLFVNDGSSDGSLAILKEFAAQDPKVKLVNFSRNFGHEAAMIAGIDHFDGDGLVCMDADLQHPPECLLEIVEKFDEGYEVISMVRTRNKTAGLVKNVTSAAFYKLINHLSDVKFEANASDFFAVSKNAAEVLRNNYREKVRFLRVRDKLQLIAQPFDGRARVKRTALKRIGRLAIHAPTDRRISPRSEKTGLSPVFISTKQPVPYVFFAMPLSKQHCPNSAACWSPAMPAIGIFLPSIVSEHMPTTPEESTTFGSASRGIPNTFSIFSSQSSF